MVWITFINSLTEVIRSWIANVDFLFQIQEIEFLGLKMEISIFSIFGFATLSILILAIILKGVLK